jgi:hypothetical protein
MILAPALLAAGLLQGEVPRELHGVWLSVDDRDVLSSRAKIAGAMEFLLDAGANVVFVPAWAGGVSFFQSTTLKDLLGLEAGGRDVLEEVLFEAHRVGLEVIPWFEPGIPCASEADCPLLKKKPEFFERDEGGKIVVEHGVARLDLANANGRDLLKSVVLEVCQNFDVDGVVGTEPVAALAKDVSAIDAMLVVPTVAGSHREGSGAGLALPLLDAPDPERGGDRLINYGHLVEKSGELEETLKNGAWAEPALVPWRGGKPWRRKIETVDPAAGAGAWSWAHKAGEPQYLTLNGGEHGHATWTFAPKEAGVYSLYVWIPPRADQSKHASYRTTSAVGGQNLVFDPTLERNRGWVRLGNVRLEARKEVEVARLLSEEDDATKVTTAGVLLPLLNRRAMRH